MQHPQQQYKLSQGVLQLVCTFCGNLMRLRSLQEDVSVAGQQVSKSAVLAVLGSLGTLKVKMTRFEGHFDHSTFPQDHFPDEKLITLHA